MFKFCHFQVAESKLSLFIQDAMKSNIQCLKVTILKFAVTSCQLQFTSQYFQIFYLYLRSKVKRLQIKKLQVIKSHIYKLRVENLHVNSYEYKTQTMSTKIRK